MTPATKPRIKWAVMNPEGIILVSGLPCPQLTCEHFEQQQAMRWPDAERQGYELCELQATAA